jgi:thioredoxin-like negative regulator of GroEL
MGLKSVTARNYEEVIVLSPKPVVIHLYANWCSGPCGMVENTLAQVNEEYGDYITMVKMSLDTQPDLTELFEVDRIPLTLMMTGGVITKKIYGLPSKEEFIEELELPTIKDFRDRGITYHPKRNYIPGYIKNEW